MYPFGDKQYQFLKWLSMVALPALAAFVGALGLALGWEIVATVVTIIAAAGAFVGALVGVSNATYTAAKKYTDELKGGEK